MGEQITIGKLERLILKALVIFPSLTLGELKGELKLTSSPYASLNNLESKGLIDIERNKYRRNKFSLTQAGKKLAESLF